MFQLKTNNTVKEDAAEYFIFLIMGKCCWIAFI